jgi:two-component system, chemotaxis family, protein-glutamate methylesterase/glutaminase
MTPLVAIGGSAGAIEALKILLPQLRPEWGIAFAIVVHRQAVEQDERLESVLSSWSQLPLRKAKDGAPIIGGRGVVCPADVHLTTSGGAYRLSTAPKENHSRPSLDVTFRAIAEEYGASGGAVVLSGLLDDGAAGINTLRMRGGLTIAQSPHDALHSGMPNNAIAAGAEYVEDTTGIAERLAEFAEQVRTNKVAGMKKVGSSGELTRLTCPDCHGVLEQVREGKYEFYRCRVGHAFSMESLNEEKEVEIEEALWAAIQVLDEQVDLLDRAARHARSHGKNDLADRIATHAAHQRARVRAVQRGLNSPREAIEDSELRDALN